MKRTLLVLGIVLALGAVIAAGLGFGGSPDPKPASSTLPPATATVTRQTLVDTQTETGELGYGDAVTVNGKLSGTVTSLPAKGSIVDRGKAIYHVDNSPVVLLYGGLPAYRTLTTGLDGADVKQFEENLAALGYKGFTVDDEYTAATATAVKKWQRDLGLDKTGTVEPGRIVYATGQIRVDSHKAAVGDEARSALLTYTAQGRVVRVELDLSDQRLAVKDAPVRVKLPDGKTVDGKIVDTSTTVDEQENQSTTKIVVTVAAEEKAFEGLDQASLDVIFTASKREKVLTVPVAALLALPEGGYGVQLTDGRVMPVQTGLFAGGRVEVTGVDEGVTVGMPT
ncbi:peptidoglycan-binding protein [Kibdelosporangium aridum]|uniref:Peptidoglycan-binding protein n=1 Tax=Kibdelosporangium aridum TaxID=2030 RepID=A0A428Z5Z2_KIBAR|nr:peptidoglycan-binding domain-containing protein [Kibdelosporangium aridum]RSM82492.1 peptidoglycan-binding protein [Kibdelosporangium aridum]